MNRGKDSSHFALRLSFIVIFSSVKHIDAIFKGGLDNVFGGITFCSPTLQSIPSDSAPLWKSNSCAPRSTLCTSSELVRSAICERVTYSLQGRRQAPSIRFPQACGRACFWGQILVSQPTLTLLDVVMRTKITLV